MFVMPSSRARPKKPAATVVTPGGSDTQVQYNNNGAFGASANFTINASTGQIQINGSNPAYLFAGSDTGTYNPAGSVIAFKSSGSWIGDCDSNWGAKQPLAQGFGWASGSTSAPDTRFTRLAGASVALGSGAQGDFSGTLKLATLNTTTAYQANGTPGISATITTAKVTPATGANGSMTFVNGILTAQTQAT